MNEEVLSAAITGHASVRERSIPFFLDIVSGDSLAEPVSFFFEASEISRSRKASATREAEKPISPFILFEHRSFVPERSAWHLSEIDPQKIIDGRAQMADFELNLLRMLEIEPIDDGYSHPAEKIMEKALKQNRTTAIGWIQSLFLKNIRRPAMAAIILRCIGRFRRELTLPWGIAMSISGLSHPNIEVREAAVRALEAWGGSESLETLKIYAELETSPWLKGYIKQVIKDLSD